MQSTNTLKKKCHNKNAKKMQVFLLEKPWLKCRTEEIRIMKITWLNILFACSNLINPVSYKNQINTPRGSDRYPFPDRCYNLTVPPLWTRLYSYHITCLFRLTRLPQPKKISLYLDISILHILVYRFFKVSEIIKIKELDFD